MSVTQSTIFVGVLRRETKLLVLDVDGGEQLVLGPASICGLFADGLRVNASGKRHAGTCTCLGEHGRSHLELDWLRVEGVPLPNLEPEPITGHGRDQE